MTRIKKLPEASRGKEQGGGRLKHRMKSRLKIVDNYSSPRSRAASSDDTIKSGNSRFSDLENCPIFFTRRGAPVGGWSKRGEKNARLFGAGELGRGEEISRKV